MCTLVTCKPEVQQQVNISRSVTWWCFTPVEIANVHLSVLESRNDEFTHYYTAGSQTPKTNSWGMLCGPWIGSKHIV